MSSYTEGRQLPITRIKIDLYHACLTSCLISRLGGSRQWWCSQISRFRACAGRSCKPRVLSHAQPARPCMTSHKVKYLPRFAGLSLMFSSLRPPTCSSEDVRDNFILLLLRASLFILPSAAFSTHHLSGSLVIFCLTRTLAVGFIVSSRPSAVVSFIQDSFGYCWSVVRHF